MCSQADLLITSNPINHHWIQYDSIIAKMSEILRHLWCLFHFIQARRLNPWDFHLIKLSISTGCVQNYAPPNTSGNSQPESIISVGWGSAKTLGISSLVNTPLKFNIEKWWLEDDPASYWVSVTFQGRTCWEKLPWGVFSMDFSGSGDRW